MLINRVLIGSILRTNYVQANTHTVPKLSPPPTNNSEKKINLQSNAVFHSRTVSRQRTQVLASILIIIALSQTSLRHSISSPIRPKIRIQTPRIRINNRIIQTRDTHIRLQVCAMGEYPLNARTVVHSEVEPDDRAVGPAYYCYSGDFLVVEESDGVVREVVVVEGCEVCVGGAAFAAGAKQLHLAVLVTIWQYIVLSRYIDKI
jgi:hypothetical protein